jgi:hypothetical protein
LEVLARAVQAVQGKLLRYLAEHTLAAEAVVLKPAVLHRVVLAAAEMAELFQI